MSRDCFACAQRVFDSENPSTYRSTVNRAYYAAYSAATFAILSQRPRRFLHGWNNPPHDDLPELILHVGTLPRDVRRNLARSLRILREARTDADYRPGRTIAKANAIIALQEAESVLYNLQLR